MLGLYSVCHHCRAPRASAKVKLTPSKQHRDLGQATNRKTANGAFDKSYLGKLAFSRYFDLGRGLIVICYTVAYTTCTVWFMQNPV